MCTMNSFSFVRQGCASLLTQDMQLRHAGTAGAAESPLPPWPSLTEPPVPIRQLHRAVAGWAWCVSHTRFFVAKFTLLRLTKYRYEPSVFLASTITGLATLLALRHTTPVRNNLAMRVVF